MLGCPRQLAIHLLPTGVLEATRPAEDELKLGLPEIHLAGIGEKRYRGLDH